MRGIARTLGVLMMLSLVAAACSVEQQHGYVQSSDGSLSFRHPVAWEDVELTPITTEWVTGLDAGSAPSDSNLAQLVLDAPFVLAEVYPLEGTSRDAISLSSLRELALASGVDPTSGRDPEIQMLFHNTIVDEYGFEGHHMRFEINVEDGTAVEEQLAVFDPNRDRIHRVRVTCSTACFDANLVVIDELFDSIRLRP